MSASACVHKHTQMKSVRGIVTSSLSQPDNLAFFASDPIGKNYSRLLVTCPVTSVKLQIANYFWLTANPITVCHPKVICYLQFHTCNWTGDQQSTVLHDTIQVTSSILASLPTPNLALTRVYIRKKCLA